GAYQLRQENPRTTLFAFFGGIALILTLLVSWTFLSSFGSKAEPIVIDDDGTIITISDFNYPKKDPETTKAVAPLEKDEPTEKKIEKEDLKNVVLVKDNPDDVRTNKEMKENPITDTNTDATRTTGTVGTNLISTTVNTGTAISPTKGAEGTNTVSELDRLPEYPGTMKKFYKDIIDNIRRPDVDDSGVTISVIMSFVIEKDGTMSDIKAVRSTDKNLEKEAIRVLKAMKIKWSPGWKDGEKVRTLFMLPIKVVL
ncbi:MAG: energy transducer TonB, partial [Bacteroidota bacterium]